MQTLAVLITAVVSLVVTACFVWVLLHSKGSSSLEKIAVPAYRARSRLLTLALVAGIVIALTTLIPWPYDAEAGSVTRHIDVKAQQWSWELSDDKARVGEVIEFRVTSNDVNHGFALYDVEHRIVAQIQAMPGFLNKVRYRFTQPGRYQILCLEYCGLVHHGMLAVIDVQPAAAK